MDFHHRKLLQIPPICQSFCEPSNVSHYCLPICVYYCSDICNFPDIPTFNPPPSPIPNRNNDCSSPNNHCSRPNKSVTITVVLLVIGFLLVFFCAMYAKLHKNSRNRTQELQPPADQPHDNLTYQDHGAVFKYKRGDGLIQGTECSVCLNEFREEETLRLLPECSHAFHTHCIDSWLKSHTNCPNCRAPMVKNVAISSSSNTETATTSYAANVDNLGASEETRLSIPEGDAESERETDIGAQEIRSGRQGQRKLGVGNERKRCGSLKEGECLAQPMRRSVSLDSLSANVNSGTQMVQSNESSAGIVLKECNHRNDSFPRSMADSSSQNRPSSLTRSCSMNANFLF